MLVMIQAELFLRYPVEYNWAADTLDFMCSDCGQIWTAESKAEGIETILWHLCTSDHA